MIPSDDIVFLNKANEINIDSDKRCCPYCERKCSLDVNISFRHDGSTKMIINIMKERHDAPIELIEVKNGS